VIAIAAQLAAPFRWAQDKTNEQVSRTLVGILEAPPPRYVVDQDVQHVLTGGNVGDQLAQGQTPVDGKRALAGILVCDDDLDAMQGGDGGLLIGGLNTADNRSTSVRTGQPCCALTRYRSGVGYQVRCRLPLRAGG